MTDQVGTPGSNAESSVNNNSNKAPASKDKACPFCQQPFTSSSLGRHLDLYIKEKNPKPPDGVHDVVEIRKMRGGITRRQPRTSLHRREGSTPSGTPVLNGSNSNSNSGRRSPLSDSGRDRSREQEVRSPMLQRYAPDEIPKGGVVTSFYDRPSWHATGVINDIPAVLPVDSSSGRQDDIDYGARKGNGHRTVSKQMLAKSTFDHKQKLMEALDSARASELALREVLGSIRAATEQVTSNSTPFDYDPLSLDFPALTLHCLPPPPTLKSVSPIPSPRSWSINPPGQQQHDALRAHFSDAFRSWHASQAIHPRPDPDDIVYPSHDRADTPNSSSSATNSSAIIQAQVTDLEERVSHHLSATYLHWSSLPASQQAEYWRLELSRAVGAKSDTITNLKLNCEKILQENAHLRQQVEYLSRCQQPREFQMMPPATVPINANVVSQLGEMGIRQVEAVGLTVADKNEPLHELVAKSIGRWKEVVKTARGAGKGMEGQRAMSTGSTRDAGNPHLRSTSNLSRNSSGAVGDVEMNDVDAEADADGEVDGENDTDTEGQYGRVRTAHLAPMINNPGIRVGLVNGDDKGINAGAYKPTRS